MSNTLLERSVRLAPDVSPPRPARRLMLLLTNLSLDGGAEVQAVQLALRLQARGWDVSVTSLLPPGDVRPLREAGIPVDTVHMRKRFSDLKALGDLIHLIRRRDPHVVHCHMTHAILAARLARLAVKIPAVVGTLHGLMIYSVAGRSQRWLTLAHRLTDRLSEVTTAVCTEAAEVYRREKTVSPARLRFIPNGIDTQRFIIDPDRRRTMRAALDLGGEFTWIMVGRFQPVKDHCTALHAFAAYLRQHPDSRLLLAGTGPLDTELKNLTRSLGLDSKVRFLGVRADIEELLNASDALLLTSTLEALPMVLLEAGSSGLPCVATRVGGNVDAIVDGVTGRLAPVGDAQALSEAMAEIASLSRPERELMGLAAREHIVRNFEFEAVIDQWEALYEELLAGKEVRP